MMQGRLYTCGGALVLLAYAVALVACSGQGDPADRAEAEQVFYEYKAAVLGNDGVSAVSLVTADTLDMYGRFVDLALDADVQQSKALPFVDIISVLMARHRLGVAELRGMDGRDLFRIGVEREWTSPDSVRHIETTGVRVDGDVAWIDVRNGDGRQRKAFRLVRVNGDWKIDLTYTLKLSEPAFKRMIEESGMSENEFVFLAVSIDGSGPVDETTIWRPVGR